MEEELPLGLDVSRETSARLREYLAMVVKWNPAINLVAPASLGHGWERHIVDSLQLWALAGATKGRWLDLGSGGGFPGMVIAILAHELAPEMHVTLVDSDRRKCVFLREVARNLGLTVDIRAERIESMPSMEADVLSARALAPLVDLIGFALSHIRRDGLALFPKGRAFQDEISAARRLYRFDLDAVPSRTDTAAVILKIRNIQNG